MKLGPLLVMKKARPAMLVDCWSRCSAVCQEVVYELVAITCVYRAVNVKRISAPWFPLPQKVVTRYCDALGPTKVAPHLFEPM
jgi:hypothetical protein